MAWKCLIIIAGSGNSYQRKLPSVVAKWHSNETNSWQDYIAIISSQTWEVRRDNFFFITFITFHLDHFSRGQNRESRSSVFLCSETKQKRLLRRLRLIRTLCFVPGERKPLIRPGYPVNTDTFYACFLVLMKGV